MKPDPKIEKLKRRIKDLEQSETIAKSKSIRFQKFLDAFPFGIYIVNGQFEIEYTNSRLQDEFGYPDGKKCYQYFHDLETACPWCKNEKVFKGETVRWYWHSEKTNRDYELFDLPLKNDDGSVSKIEIFNDITELRHLEQKQQRAKNLLEKIYESLDQAVFVVDPKDRTILSCNTASERIFGYSKDEMMGNAQNFFMKTGLPFGNMAKTTRALASGTKFHAEFSLKDKNGKVFPTEHIVKIGQDVPGLPPIHVAVVKDLTFRKLAEEKLQHQQEELKKRAQSLEELNAALKVLLDQREKERIDVEAGLLEKLNGLIIPTINKLRNKNSHDNPTDLLNILEANIREIARPAHRNISNEMLRLSPTENTIADLIKSGYRTKEIAGKMNISARTVEFHRDNIRKKLKIKGRKVNLKTYLSRIS